MSKKRYINTRFWDDSYIIELGTAEKLLFIYLLTNPLTNIAGVYEISLGRIAFDTGIESNQINLMLKRFSDDTKVHYLDGWIIMKNSIKHQTLNPSVVQGIKRELDEVPEFIKDRLGTDWDTLYNTQLEYKSKLSISINSIYIEKFEEFWKLYPRKVTKRKALEAFVKLEPSDNLFKRMMKSLEEHKKSEQWGNQKYIPHPTTWLNQGRWEDEVIIKQQGKKY